MSDEWTEQDEQQLRELRRRKKAYQITQQGRKRQFGAKKYKPLNMDKTVKEK